MIWPPPGPPLVKVLPAPTSPAARGSGGYSFGSIFLLWMITCTNCYDISTLKTDVSALKFPLDRASGSDLRSAERNLGQVERDLTTARRDLAAVKGRLDATFENVLELNRRVDFLERSCVHRNDALPARGCPVDANGTVRCP